MQISVTRKNTRAQHAILSPSPDFAKMGRVVGGQTSWEGRQQLTQVEHLKEPSSLEKRLECRVVEQWLQEWEEVPEQGQQHVQVVEQWVVHRQEAK